MLVSLPNLKIRGQIGNDTQFFISKSKIECGKEIIVEPTQYKIDF